MESKGSVGSQKVLSRCNSHGERLGSASSIKSGGSETGKQSVVLMYFKIRVACYILELYGSRFSNTKEDWFMKNLRFIFICLCNIPLIARFFIFADAIVLS